MSNHENEIQFESYLKDVKETVGTPSDELRDSAIKEGMGKMLSKIGKLDIKVNPKLDKEVKEEVQPHYVGTELADLAVDVYKSNIKEEEDCEKKNELLNAGEHPCTKASRENTKATIRALAGMRNPASSGDEGKYSPSATSSGAGNTGGLGGNVTVAPLSLEDYKSQIFKDFGLIEEEVTYSELEEEVSEEFEETDLVCELEENLLELSDRDWIEVDKVTRQLCYEHGVLVKDLNRDFRSRHGVFPDKWIKEQVEVEQCGWFPLDEMVRINKMGMIYDVTFMFRGGTQRFKFFWPEATRPTRSQMQDAVEKFYPKARLLAFYPSMKQDGINHMVMVPPMTESYEIVSQELWVEMTEEESQIYEIICEEEGEPLSPPVIQEDGSTLMFIEDHDTGEEREVMWEANKSGDNSLRDWFGKSKSSDGTKGWVQLGGKFAGKPCAKQEGQTTKPKCGSSKMKRDLNKDEEQAAFSRKNREDGDPNRSGKAKNVRTEEVVMEGEKDACYNKVKSRYKVWPSAYASGALVKCRKKGAANWGNSKKNEEVTHVDEACWKGYTKKGMKTMFGKKYPNCVKKEEVENVEEGNVSGIETSRKIRKAFMDKKYNAPKVPPKQEPVDKIASFSLERPNPMKEEVVTEESKRELQNKAARGDRSAMNKLRQLRAAGKIGKESKAAWGPGAKKDIPDMKKIMGIEANEEFIPEGDEMKGLTQKGGHKRSTESGAGLTQKGVDAVNRKTGGNLKTAVTTPPSKLKPGSKAAGRRKSFCARSRGWDGERGKAARRRWNC